LADEGQNRGAVEIGVGQHTEVSAHAAATRAYRARKPPSTA
jgi:hypothetical protein